MYQIPVEANAGAALTAPPGGWLASWAAVIGALNPPFVTGAGWDSRGNGGAGDLSQYFARGLTDDGRPIWLMGGLAEMVDAGDPGAASAWAWFLSNVYRAIPPADLQADPRWAIVPRSDGNTLPAIPTAVP